VTDSQLVPVVDTAHVAADDVATDSAGSTEAIVVRLGTGRFAVDLASVAEVGKAPAITRVPGLPVWLSGVANWRGRILPVLDLRPLLGAAAAPLDSHGRLLVLTGGGIAVGMVVDAVDGTTSLTGVAPFPTGSGANSSHLLSGQVARDEGPLAVLDVAGVMRLREGLPRGRRSA
jgi:chemotaxis signal transduction protein